MTHSAPRALVSDIAVHDLAFELLTQQLPAPARVVDLGAGEGAFTQRLMNAGYDVVPVDNEPARWKLADVPLLRRDLNDSFGEALQADGVCAIEVIEHLESPLHLLRSCRSMLRPGGILVVTSPNVESVASRMIFMWNGRFRFFSTDETQGHHLVPLFSWQLDTFLERSGFELLEERFSSNTWDTGRSLKARAGSVAARLLAPWVSGSKRGEIRILLARAI